MSHVSGISLSSVASTLANTDNLLEGLFWGSWCGLNVHNWAQARQEKKEAENLPESADKSARLWLANKKYILSSFSFVSGISMVTSWLQEMKILSLGAVGPLISSMGYGGSGFVSSVKFWDSLQELDHEVARFNRILDPREKVRSFLHQLETLVKTAFFATLAAWGALGSVHALFGGEFLFRAMDTSLYYAAVLFFVNIVGSVFFSILKKMA